MNIQDPVTRCLNRLVSDGGSMDSEVVEAFALLGRVGKHVIDIQSELEILRGDLAMANAELEQLRSAQ